MPEAYFIGGAPRAGKTTALKRFVARSGVLGVSTDAIRATIKGVLKQEENIDLFKASRGAFDSPENVNNMANNPRLIVDHQNRESEVVWESVVTFVDSNLEDGQDVAVEGVAVLPKQLKQYKGNSKTVFIINTEDQTDIILQHARNNHHDWLHKYSDETIKAFCIFNRDLNLFYLEQAKKYGFPYVIVDTDNFDVSIDQAIDILVMR